MSRILLTGVSGQVGWELKRTLSNLGEVITTSRDVNATDFYMDLSQPESIRQAIQEIQPDLIINPGAYTAVDKAELEPELAMLVNGVAPGILAEEAKLVGAGLIHYSTDYVFNGRSSHPYQETDEPDPQNIYGKTKLAGEKAIQAIEIPHLIIRTSWVYGLRGKNFLMTMLQLAKEREEIKVVNDQIGTPTWSRLIAESTAQILFLGKSNFRDFLHHHSGIYHLTSTGQTSWYDFAKAIFEMTPNRNQYKLQNLIPIPTVEYPTPAERPAFSILDTQKIYQTFGLILPDWKDNLKLVKSSYF
jgi:dTDP-4-dehydrorhamnose reductase